MNDVNDLVELHMEFAFDNELCDLKTISGRGQQERRTIIPQFVNVKKVTSSKLKAFERNEHNYEANVYSKDYFYIFEEEKLRLINDYRNLEFSYDDDEKQFYYQKR